MVTKRLVKAEETVEQLWLIEFDSNTCWRDYYKAIRELTREFKDQDVTVTNSKEGVLVRIRRARELK
jgi:hypothetical protein